MEWDHSDKTSLSMIPIWVEDNFDPIPYPSKKKPTLIFG